MKKVKGRLIISAGTSRPVAQQNFLAPRYIWRLAKNPIFEVISLLIPTGPLKNSD